MLTLEEGRSLLVTPWFATKKRVSSFSSLEFLGCLGFFFVLTIEDKIVYQAVVNVIAERLYPRVKNRYYKEVF